MRKKITKIFTSIFVLSLLAVICVMPTFAGVTNSWLDLRISGTGNDYSLRQYSEFYTPEWCIVLDHDYDRPECVLCADLRTYNEYNAERGYMEVYEGTGNHSGSRIIEPGYGYRISGLREHNWDEYVTVQGHWDLNWNWQYDYDNYDFDN